MKNRPATHWLRGGVPVISRLPSLGGTASSLAGDTLREPVPADENPTECCPEMASYADPMAEQDDVERDLPTGTADDAVERHGKKLLASITSFPWNNILVCLGLAGLFVLALAAVSRPRATAIAPPTPPSVHYHIMPPQHAVPQMAETAPVAVQSEQPTDSALAQREALSADDGTRRIARRDIEPVTASPPPTDSSSDDAPEESTAGDEAQTSVDIAAAANGLEEYPSTEFPDLPLPAAPENREPTTSGVRLNGNIEKFKK